jgi:RNA polymerase sigma factor (sigma-70 family)
MASSELSDHALLAATADDPEAFGYFYRRHVSAVVALLLHRTRDAERALDLTAEVFVAALEGSHRYNPARGPARAWLFGIARNVLADSYRDRAAAERARRRLGLEPLVFEDSELERAEQLIDLDRQGAWFSVLVDDLPESERAAVTARVIQEQDYADIASQQGVSEQAVRQRVSRGLARLARLNRGDQHV